MLGKDLYNQTIIISVRKNDTFNSDHAFPVSFPNIFVDYLLGEMQTTYMKWKHWNKALFRLWQTQLNFAVFCTSSACRVSSEHLNYKTHSMVRPLYLFHMYYHVRKVLKRLQVPLPCKAGFNAADNPYSSKRFSKLYEDYGVPHDPMRYQYEKFFGTHQRLFELHRP